MSGPIDVKLFWEEFMQASNAACCRILSSATRGDKPAHGAPDGPEGDLLHYQGCRGEVAVARHYNFYWSPKSGVYRTAADVGGKIEVRCRSVDWYDLILRERDRDLSRPYVLAIDGQPKDRLTIKLIGWITGKEGREKGTFKDPTNTGRERAWFVEQKLLHDLDELPAWLDARKPNGKANGTAHHEARP